MTSLPSGAYQLEVPCEGFQQRFSCTCGSEKAELNLYTGMQGRRASEPVCAVPSLLRVRIGLLVVEYPHCPFTTMRGPTLHPSHLLQTTKNDLQLISLRGSLTRVRISPPARHRHIMWTFKLTLVKISKPPQLHHHLGPPPVGRGAGSECSAFPHARCERRPTARRPDRFCTGTPTTSSPQPTPPTGLRGARWRDPDRSMATRRHPCERNRAECGPSFHRDCLPAPHAGWLRDFHRC